VTGHDRTAMSLAAAIEALVLPNPDIADILAHLVAEGARSTSADACALMASDVNGELSLLAAQSHSAVELEMLQIQREVGPCIDVIAEGLPVHAAGAETLRQRWGKVGDGIVDAGFGAVDGYPMRWRGTVLGGLNLFYADPDQPAAGAVAQAYADMATLVVVQATSVDSDQVRARLNEALSSRGVVEQAKGVIAYQERVDMGAAYASLLRRAEATGAGLTSTALEIVAEAMERSRRAE
jgi:hypothetical protein